MGLFSFLFGGGGKYPSTKKYEAQLAQLDADYAKFKQIASGNELKKLVALRESTNTSDFKNRVSKLKNDKYKGSEEERKEKEFAALGKRKDVKDYLAVVGSGKDKQIERVVNTNDYKQYQSLAKTVSSADFQKKAKDPNSAEAKTLQTFKSLEANGEIKDAVKTLASEQYKNYQSVAKSDTPKKYEALKAYLESNEFKTRKAYLQDTGRFKNSQENKDLQELASLEKNKDLKWYEEKLAKKAFAEMDKYTPTFVEEFKGSKLDGSKWMLGYYLGKKVNNLVYSQADERQAFTDGNAVVHGGLEIVTKPGKVKGKVWNPLAGGFVDKEFEGSSALVNTGDGFRQKYGRFDFKVRVRGAKSPNKHSVALGSEKNTAEISVAAFGVANKQVTMGSSLNGKSNYSDIPEIKFEDDYVIYSLLWTPDKLTWKVNGVEAYTQKSGVPQEDLFIVLSSNVIGEGAFESASLDVEWIKVYSVK